MKRRAAGASIKLAGSPSVAPATPTDGLKRVAIEAVTPEIDSGRFPAKRVVGETVVVEADIFTDGHDALAAIVRYRHQAATGWRETPMAPLVNDRWRGEFPVTELGRYVYTIEAWVDHFESWSRQLAKRVAAGQDVTVELEVGARMLEETAGRENGAAADAARLRELARSLRAPRQVAEPSPHPPGIAARSGSPSPASGEGKSGPPSPASGEGKPIPRLRRVLSLEWGRVASP